MEKDTYSKAWMEKISLPTYEAAEPTKSPQFLDNRVYQGSSGKAYPYPITESVSDIKTEKEYVALFLENKYLKIMILPELGGRIHKAFDKIGNRDFVYYNQVIKPVLVGLLGPWISGGIEFNWPQHHRPTTFMSTDWSIKEEDGKSTVYISELEKMSGQRVLLAISLYEDKAYIEISARLYNSSPLPQTFLWWANPAVKAGDGHQSIFPPDVTAVCDHGKRDISRFPIATGLYYKEDYSSGVDISRYKNIPVPTSYMAWKSNYDFVGAYCHDEKAGLMHVADRHVVPGKKQWTWGNSDFGQAWDHNLTEVDGPYIELMTGAFTDNQPDFTWIEPWEEKCFTQYFMPYRDLGVIHNANKNIMLKCEINTNEIHLGLFATTNISCKCILKNDGDILFNSDINLKTGDCWQKTLDIDIKSNENLSFSVYDKSDKLIIKYIPEKEKIDTLPEPSTPPEEPQKIMNIDELYFIGLHIEQYRYATSSPEIYWNEAIKRDPLDSRCNTALARLFIKKGNFKKAYIHLQNALKRITMKNTNPESGKINFLLGLCLEYLDNDEASYAYYYKSVWNGDYRDKGFFALTKLALKQNDIEKSLEFLKLSLAHNTLNHKARHLDIVLSRKQNDKNIMEKIKNYLDDDLLSFGIMYEKYLQTKDDKDKGYLLSKMGENSDSFIEVSLLYSSSGLYEDALNVLNMLDKTDNPIFYYHKAYIYHKLNDDIKAKDCIKQSMNIKYSIFFPNRLDDIKPLYFAKENASPMASYLLGCFFYDKKEYDESINLWKYSLNLEDKAVVNRCLAISSYNVEKKPIEARYYLDKSLELEPEEARYLFERDDLAKKLGESPKERLERLDKMFEITQKRDDLICEWVGLVNIKGDYEKAISVLKSRQFHPWEGGEGHVTTRWILSHLYLAISKIGYSKYEEAIALLKIAKSYPRNLGEGKLPGTSDNDILFWHAYSLLKLDQKDEANKIFLQASEGTEEVKSILYYNDYPADFIFWQGVSLKMLNKETSAKRKFYTLIDYAEKHLNDEIKLDFLSVSLPSTIAFYEDLSIKNKVHCYFLLAMGYYGLDDKIKSEMYIDMALKMDPSHLKVQFINWVMSKSLI